MAAPAGWRGASREAAMRLDDLILVSVDDHACEPEDMFERHISPKFKGREPRVARTPVGQAWEIEGKVSPGLGLNAVMGRPKEEFGIEPYEFKQLRKGAYDVHARIDDMNANGVLGSICFPQFPGFAGRRFWDMHDKDLALATIRAYNDWHIHDWCGAYPDRFIPLGILPLWSIDETLAELKRLIKLGFHTIAFPDNPAVVGLPSLHNEQWRPLWKLCQDNRVVLSCHIGTGASASHASDESPIGAWITSMPISIANSAADWTFATFWDDFPGLRMALSEGGIGWIPYFLERADAVQRQHGAWTNRDFHGSRPSEVFRKHIITCFIEDAHGLKSRHEIGIDMITWECDYPHSDCAWPYSPEVLWEQVKAFPKDEIDKITHLNVMREFSYDPFVAASREDCTVGALRARAAHVKTAAEPALGGLTSPYDPTRPVTTADVKKVLSAV
jgi:predicted TIM-barrel fold metal-dependent hydrolase